MKSKLRVAAMTALFLLVSGSAWAQFVPGNSPAAQAAKGKRYGPGDGTGNQGQGPRDGTGYGAKSGKRQGSQDCTGIGRTSQARSQQGRRGRR